MARATKGVRFMCPRCPVRFISLEAYRHHLPCGSCSLCGRDDGEPLPYETPNDPPIFPGGHHCQECEDWLQTGELDG